MTDYAHDEQPGKSVYSRCEDAFSDSDASKSKIFSSKFASINQVTHKSQKDFIQGSFDYTGSSYNVKGFGLANATRFQEHQYMINNDQILLHTVLKKLQVDTANSTMLDDPDQKGEPEAEAMLENIREIRSDLS